MLKVENDTPLDPKGLPSVYEKDTLSSTVVSDDRNLPQRTTKEKLTLFREFTSVLTQANGSVIRLFLITTLLMFSLPILALFGSMRLARMMEWEDPETIGAFSALGMTVLVSAGYVVVALKDDTLTPEAQQKKRD